MAERQERRAPTAQGAQVVRTEQITPHMVRVVLGGDGLAGFELAGFADHYVKLCFAPEGADYAHPFDMARIREEYPRAQWPTTRTYTVRSWDPAARELAIDFVVHGDEGLAGPWASRAQPGDQVTFLGPGGGYGPQASADWHLLVGDESALPHDRRGPGADAAWARWCTPSSRSRTPRRSRRSSRPTERW